MKLLSENLGVTGSNAWGRPSRTDWRTYAIEESDIGQTRANFQGMGYAHHTFSRADIGKTITVYSSPGWTCWTFNI